VFLYPKELWHFHENATPDDRTSKCEHDSHLAKTSFNCLVCQFNTPVFLDSSGHLAFSILQLSSKFYAFPSFNFAFSYFGIPLPRGPPQA